MSSLSARQDPAGQLFLTDSRANRKYQDSEEAPLGGFGLGEKQRRKTVHHSDFVETFVSGPSIKGAFLGASRMRRAATADAGVISQREMSWASTSEKIIKKMQQQQEKRKQALQFSTKDEEEEEYNDTEKAIMSRGQGKLGRMDVAGQAAANGQEGDLKSTWMDVRNQMWSSERSAGPTGSRPQGTAMLRIAMNQKQSSGSGSIATYFTQLRKQRLVQDRDEFESLHKGNEEQARIAKGTKGFLDLMDAQDPVATGQQKATEVKPSGSDIANTSDDIRKEANRQLPAKAQFTSKSNSAQSAANVLWSSSPHSKRKLYEDRSGAESMGIFFIIVKTGSFTSNFRLSDISISMRSSSSYFMCGCRSPGILGGTGLHESLGTKAASSGESLARASTMPAKKKPPKMDNVVNRTNLNQLLTKSSTKLVGEKQDESSGSKPKIHRGQTVRFCLENPENTIQERAEKKISQSEVPVHPQLRDVESFDLKKPVSLFETSTTSSSVLQKEKNSGLGFASRDHNFVMKKQNGIDSKIGALRADTQTLIMGKAAHTAVHESIKDSRQVNASSLESLHSRQDGAKEISLENHSVSEAEQRTDEQAQSGRRLSRRVSRSNIFPAPGIQSHAPISEAASDRPLASIMQTRRLSTREAGDTTVEVHPGDVQGEASCVSSGIERQWRRESPPTSEYQVHGPSLSPTSEYRVHGPSPQARLNLSDHSTKQPLEETIVRREMPVEKMPPSQDKKQDVFMQRWHRNKDYLKANKKAASRAPDEKETRK